MALYLGHLAAAGRTIASIQQARSAISHFHAAAGMERSENPASVVVPMPGERRRFDPMDEREGAWRHMGKRVNAALPLLTKFEHEFDHRSPTELVLECVAVFGKVVQRVARSHPWHGGEIVILARNDPQQACLYCRRPAQWKFIPDYDEELYENDAAMSADDLDPGTFCKDCAPDDGDFIPLPNSHRE